MNYFGLQRHFSGSRNVRCPINNSSQSFIFKQRLMERLQHTQWNTANLSRPFFTLQQRVQSTCVHTTRSIVTTPKQRGTHCVRTITTRNHGNGRLPTPPMPRKNYEAIIEEYEVDTSNLGIGARIRLLHDKGTAYIAIGWALLLAIVLEIYIQKVGSDYNENLDKDAMINDIVVSIKKQRQIMYETYSNAPAIYQCRIVRYYKMGGSRGLYNIHLDDIVDVVEENVGPKQSYHLCRYVRSLTEKEIEREEKNKDSSSNSDKMPLYKDENGNVIELGWYPISYLEKYIPPPPPKKKSWWRRILLW